MRIRRKERLKTVSTIAFLVVFLAIALFPLYWMGLTALRPPSQVLGNYELFPRLGSLRWSVFTEVFSYANKPMFRWLWNSTVVAIGTTVVSVALATFAGYSISRFRRYRETTVASYLLLVVRLLPPVLMLVPLYVVFAQLGILRSHLSLILANVSFILPFATWMLKSFFDGLPRELDLAAQVDGCNTAQMLWYVILPASLPGVAATTIYCAVFSWTEYVFASVFMNPNNYTVTVGVTTFIQEYSINWNGLMAATIVAIVPLILLFAGLERYLVRGMSAGAVTQ